MAQTKKLAPINDIPRLTDGRAFDALSAAEKRKIARYFDRKIPRRESRPLTDAEWAREKKAKAKIGRPRIGRGAKVVAVTLEKGLLERVDAYAKKHRVKRAQLIAHGLLRMIGEAPSPSIRAKAG